MFNGADNRIDNFVDTVVMITDAGYTDCSYLPQIVVIDLSNGDVELFLKTRGN
jgi:hypothetical protein